MEFSGNEQWILENFQNKTQIFNNEIFRTTWLVAKCFHKSWIRSFSKIVRKIPKSIVIEFKFRKFVFQIFGEFIHFENFETFKVTWDCLQI